MSGLSAENKIVPLSTEGPKGSAGNSGVTKTWQPRTKTLPQATSKVPIRPPKPRIYKPYVLWVVICGHEALGFITWRKAMDHALSICTGYEDRLYEWVAEGNY